MQLSASTTRRIALVTVTKGYRHTSIPTAEAVIGTIADRTTWFTVDYLRTEEDLLRLAPDNLPSYDVILFVNTSGELPLPDPDALVEWVRNGGTFVGVHSASNTLHGFPPYLEMLGGEFDFHRDQTIAEVFVESSSHPATTSLASPVTMFEEFYHLKAFHPAAVYLLVALHFDPDAKEPATMPLSWWRDFGRGRVFYTALGHREDVWESAWFQEHLTGALGWAVGGPGGATSRDQAGAPIGTT
ncbi:MAG: ThuA domain-containing protein [Thermoanaerobaculia bacterium]